LLGATQALPFIALIFLFYKFYYYKVFYLRIEKMKKCFNYFFAFASIALIGLQACSLEETAICPEEPGPGEETPIMFTTKAPTALSTRTNFDGNEWLQGDSLGIYMLYNNGTDLIANSINFNKEYLTVHGSPFNSTNGYDELTPANTVELYYKMATLLRFIGYYPYLPNITNYTIPVDVSKQDRPQDIDLLYSDNATGINTSNPGSSSRVKLDFKHVLSKLVINVEAADPLDVHIDGMQGLIKQVPVTAKFQLDQYTNLTVDAQRADVGFIGLAAAKNPNYDTTYQAILIPNTIDREVQQIEFMAGHKLFSWKLPHELTAFEQGYVYTFNLTLMSDTIAAFTGNITPWDSAYINNSAPNVPVSLDDTGTPYRRLIANNADTLDVVYIGGMTTFEMGSTKTAATGYLPSTPVHEEAINQSYHIMNAPVTNAQFCRFLNDPANRLSSVTTNATTNSISADLSALLSTSELPTGGGAVRLYQDGTDYTIKLNGSKWEPGLAANKDYPIAGVTWDGALAYAKWAGGTLPTEAQWEYAARGGVDMQYEYIDEVLAGTGMGGFAIGGTANTAAVKGARKANGYRLYDVFGNVAEWCYERVGTTTDDYSAAYATAAEGTTNGIARGGYYAKAYNTLYIGARLYNPLNTVQPWLGFRVVFNFQP
jgi:formylglycine-generating enzyme required for sulfatase activity